MPVRINRLVLDYDQILICGPVFPHEVVGFSGGNKYLFPGIGGAEIINWTHWLGALLGSYDIIGAGYTPVREMIDFAAEKVATPVACLSLVVTHEGVSGLYFGSAQEAWQAASELSSQKHIVWVERPFRRVLSVMPRLYDDLWTAAKGMYKVEPAVADGGEVVIYAPHISEVSYTHGAVHRRSRLSLPRLFPGAVGPLRPHSARRAGALDASEGQGQLRCGNRGGNPAHQRDPGNGHFRGALPAAEPRLPRSRHAFGPDKLA